MHTTSNSVSSPDLNKQTQQRRRRRNRTRNRKKQTSHQKQQDGNKQKQQQQQRLDLSDLTSEASALERQLNELQTQLKLTYANTPKKASGDAAIAEQIAATEDEMEYVRKSLKDAYRQILDKDLLFAISQRIDDKMWRHVFYANIEQVRSKLRKLRPENDHATRHRLLKAFFRHFDATFKFYRDLNNRIKDDYHVDTRTLGIDLFKQGSNQKNGRSATDEKIGQLIQSNYICMGDVARYRASQAMADNKKKIANDYWKLSKECYQKAVDVYRASGKPYSQLALVSLSNGSAIDVVFYYCMSLAMKYPSSVGRDNLRSFYSKLRFPSTKSPKEKTGTSGMIAAFVESFLQVHKDMLFGDSVDAASYTGFSGKLGQAIYNLMLASQSVDSDALSSSLLVVKTTLTRTVCILMISAWDFGERMKSKENLSQWTQLQSRQIHVLTFAFKVISALYQNIQKAQEELKDQFEAYRYEHMCDMVDKAILPGVSMWCTFLAYNLPLLAQYCAGANAEGRNIRDNDKRELVKALQAFLVCLIGHSMFPDPIANILPATYPVSEDLTLLGLMPLAKFHVTVDFFKENTYENIDEKSDAARAQIRWARVREFTKKVSESSSFEFVQYNKAEQKYSVIDENAKRQQQNRFMKALATQRLMEQVSSLEKNVNRLNLGGSQEPAEKPNICKVIVDVTAFLDSLSKLKKWSNQTLNVGSRQQSMILEVIVPLETIDSLDVHKKGNSHLNMQARESIRFLDQTLKKDSGERSLTTSFLRTQKLSEKLSEWSEAEKYWLGEGRGKNGVVVAADNVSEQSSEDEDEDGEDGLIDVLDNSDIESVSSEDLFKSRRRQFDEEEEEEEEDEEDQESGTSISDTEGSEEESEESEGEDDQDEPLVSFKDVPRTYAPIINCMLYYMTHQDPETRRQNLLQLVLVTNDENLAYWAEMFGDPNTGKRLCVKTTEEWDHLVRTGRLLEDS